VTLTDEPQNLAEGISGPLDLSDADTSGFDPIPSATYKMEIVEGKEDKVKGEDGALPKGWPCLNVQFRVPEDADEYANRRVFNRYYPVVPEGHDPDKAKKLKGMFLSFLIAAGYDEEELRSGSWEFDPDDLPGRELFITVRYVPANDEKGWAAQNRVTGVKSLAAGMATAGEGAGLL